MVFVVNKMKSLRNDVQVVSFANDIQGKGWWGGATDAEEEGSWVWITSGKPVEKFVWADGEPDNYGDEDYFWFLDWFAFKGADVPGQHKMYPLCQRQQKTPTQPPATSTSVSGFT